MSHEGHKLTKLAARLAQLTEFDAISRLAGTSRGKMPRHLNHRAIITDGLL